MFSLWGFGGLGWREVLRRMWNRFWGDRVLDQSAMLSFYFLLALFPLLLFLAALLGLMLQSGEALHQAIEQYLVKIVPTSASKLIDKTLQQISHGSSGGTLSLSLLFSLWVASSGVVAVIEALNIAYEVRESRPWWRQRVLALVLTIGLAVFLAAALVLLGYGNRVAEWMSRGFGTWTGWISTGWKVLEWLLLVGFVLMGFNLLYYFAPNVKHRRWHWLMPGTVLGVGLWVLISYGFRTYLVFFNTYNLTYGSIAGVIILLLWFYITSIAILMGGELNSVIEVQTGRGEKSQAGA